MGQLVTIDEDELEYLRDYSAYGEKLIETLENIGYSRQDLIETDSDIEQATYVLCNLLADLETCEDELRKQRNRNRQNKKNKQNTQSQNGKERNNRNTQKVSR